MRPLRPLFLLGLVSLVAGATPAAAQPDLDIPVLVEIRAAHHPGFDRLVFEFEGGLPGRTGARWVERVTEDASGRRVAVQGRAFISVSFFQAVGQSAAPGFRSSYGARVRAFDLPNLAQVVAAGDYEATLSFGVGLMRRTSILRKARLQDPSRFVIDVATSFRRRDLSVDLLDRDALDAGTPPYLRAVSRSAPLKRRVESALLRLWAGPTTAERSDGLRFRASGTTGFRDLRVADGIARLTLRGRCDGGGQAVTVADEVFATLKPFGHIRWVKIYDRAGRTQHPWGNRDSIPECLAP